MRRVESLLPGSINRIMPTRIRIPERIIEHIRIPVETLRIGRAGHKRIRLDEAPQRGVVIARVVVHQAKAGLVALPGKGVVGG